MLVALVHLFDVMLATLRVEPFMSGNHYCRSMLSAEASEKVKAKFGTNDHHNMLLFTMSRTHVMEILVGFDSALNAEIKDRQRDDTGEVASPTSSQRQRVPDASPPRKSLRKHASGNGESSESEDHHGDSGDNHGDSGVTGKLSIPDVPAHLQHIDRRCAGAFLSDDSSEEEGEEMQDQEKGGGEESAGEGGGGKDEQTP